MQPETMQITRKLSRFPKIVIYICVGLLTAGGILFRTLLGLSDIGKELIDLLVPLMVSAGIVWCGRKLSVEKAARAHPYIGAGVISALGILAVSLSEFIRQPGKSAQAWGSILFCAAGVMLLYALRNREFFGFPLLLLHQVVVAALLWHFHSTAGTALVLWVAVALSFFATKRRWFGRDRSYQGTCFFFLGTLFFNTVFELDVIDFHRLYRKLNPLGNVLSNFENAAARLTAMSAKAVGQVKSCGTYSEYVAQYMELPEEEYLLSSVLYHYGWICVIVVVVLMLVILTLGFSLCARRRGLGFYLSVTMCLYLSAQFALYLSQAFGLCIVRMLYVPFFSGQAVGGTLSLLSLLLITEGLTEEEPSAWETMTETERILTKDDEIFDDTAMMTIDCISLPNEISSITESLFSETLSWKSCDENKVKALLFPTTTCLAVTISGELSEIRQRLSKTLLFRNRVVLVKMLQHPQADSAELQAMTDAIQGLFWSKPKKLFTFIHTDEDIRECELCALTLYVL